MKPKSILVIEDDYLDIVSIKRALNKFEKKFELNIAHNGVEALEMLNGNIPDQKKVHPDIILLDINMPKMNGIEFLRIIKNYLSLNNIKIFITTTSAEEYDKLAAEQLGITGYILKPLELDIGNNVKSDDNKKLIKELVS
ncbi:MAG: response regulator [Flavipsychrobacter sp.]|jgi:CheY-like chemotaxis protein|nr:response regulator [Flavipsychrobacter sp.]